MYSFRSENKTEDDRNDGDLDKKDEDEQYIEDTDNGLFPLPILSGKINCHHMMTVSVMMMLS